jgi:DNA repair protein RadC
MAQSITVYRCVLRKARTLKVAEHLCQNAEHAARIIHALTADSPTEKLVAIFLNCRNHVIGVEVVASGHRSGIAITASEVLRGAIIANAAAIVLGHNHPSGSLDPSPEDIEMTRALKRACETVQLALLDHIIVTAHNGSVSIGPDV